MSDNKDNESNNTNTSVDNKPSVKGNTKPNTNTSVDNKPSVEKKVVTSTIKVQSKHKSILYWDHIELHPFNELTIDVNKVGEALLHKIKHAERCNLVEIK